MRIKIIVRLIVMSAFISFVGCSSEMPNAQANDLNLSIEILDANLSPKSSFTSNEQVNFKVNIRNSNTSAPLRFAFASVKCQNPLYGFDVYTTNDSFIGDLEPDEENCEFYYRIETVGSNKTLEYIGEWNSPVEGSTTNQFINRFDPGNYILKFKTKVNVHANTIRNETIELSLPFTVTP